MRSGDIAAAFVITLFAAAALLVWVASPVCACTPALPGEPSPEGLGGGPRLVAAAQARHHQQHRHYAADVTALGPVPLPPGVTLERVQRQDAGYVAVLVGLDGLSPRRCTMQGGPPAPDGEHRFTLDCRPDGDIR